MIERIHFESIDSTNEEAKRRAKKISQDQNVVAVITADKQTNGRGQKSREWFSDSQDGLYYTCMFTPKTLTNATLSTLSVTVGKRIVARLNADLKLGLELEWPNDFILDDKKCGGILIESVSGSKQERPNVVIVGIGFNLNQTEFPAVLKHVAISLRQKNQKVYNKETFIDLFTEELLQCR